MFVLDEETKARFRKEREECEAIGTTVEEMDKMRAQALDILAEADSYIGRVEPACVKYPFLQALISPHLNAIANALSVGYRLIENRRFEEDDPEQFEADRKLLLNLIKESFTTQKGMNA